MAEEKDQQQDDTEGEGFRFGLKDGDAEGKSDEDDTEGQGHNKPPLGETEEDVQGHYAKKH